MIAKRLLDTLDKIPWLQKSSLFHLFHGGFAKPNITVGKSYPNREKSYSEDSTIFRPLLKSKPPSAKRKSSS